MDLLMNTNFGILQNQSTLSLRSYIGVRTFSSGFLLDSRIRSWKSKHHTPTTMFYYDDFLFFLWNIVSLKADAQQQVQHFALVIFKMVFVFPFCASAAVPGLFFFFLTNWMSLHVALEVIYNRIIWGKHVTKVFWSSMALRWLCNRSQTDRCQQFYFSSGLELFSIEKLCLRLFTLLFVVILYLIDFPIMEIKL